MALIVRPPGGLPHPPRWWCCRADPARTWSKGAARFATTSNGWRRPSGRNPNGRPWAQPWSAAAPGGRGARRRRSAPIWPLISEASEFSRNFDFSRDGESIACAMLKEGIAKTNRRRSDSARGYQVRSRHWRASDRIVHGLREAAGKRSVRDQEQPGADQDQSPRRQGRRRGRHHRGEAVANELVDALSEFGVRHIEMPATAEVIWR